MRLLFVGALLVASTTSALAQDDAGSSTGPDAAAPVQGDTVPGGQVSTVLDIDLSALENVLGPNSVFRCTTTAINVLPVMVCADAPE